MLLPTSNPPTPPPSFAHRDPFAAVAASLAAAVVVVVVVVVWRETGMRGHDTPNKTNQDKTQRMRAQLSGPLSRWFL